MNPSSDMKPGWYSGKVLFQKLAIAYNARGDRVVVRNDLGNDFTLGVLGRNRL